MSEIENYADSDRKNRQASDHILEQTRHNRGLVIRQDDRRGGPPARRDHRPDRELPDHSICAICDGPRAHAVRLPPLPAETVVLRSRTAEARTGPEGTVFVTKTEQGTEMVPEAAAARVPFSWAAGDEVYGRSLKLRADCGTPGRPRLRGPGQLQGHHSPRAAARSPSPPWPGWFPGRRGRPALVDGGWPPRL